MKSYFKVVGALVGVAAFGAAIAKIAEGRKKEPLTRTETESQICVKMYSITPEEMHELLAALSDEEVTELLEKLNNCTGNCSHKEDEHSCENKYSCGCCDCE